MDEGTQARGKKKAVAGMMGRPVYLASLSLLLGACEDDGNFTAVSPAFDLTPAEVDFGEASLGQEAVREIELRNVGTADGDLSGFQIEDDCGACFRLLTDLPARLGVQEVVTLRLVYRAPREEEATGNLRILPVDQDEVQAPAATLLGRGRDDSRPDIEVQPATVDFGGVVPAGERAVDGVLIRSVGDGPLLVDRIFIDPPSEIFRITTSTPTPSSPGVIDPGAETSVSVRVDVPMSDTSSRSASLFIDTNVLEEKNVPGIPGRVRVPLNAEGNLAPVAVIDGPSRTDPFSQVDLSGANSFDPDMPPDLPLSYVWSLLEVPDGSLARLQSRTATTTRFLTDLSGEYLVELTVTDAKGLRGSSVLRVDASPDQGIRIELLWDHPDSDVDLHLIRAGGSFCDCQDLPGDPSDVHYRCREQDWYPEFPGANPILDLDDDEGFGPEVIALPGEGEEDFIPADSFEIQVHYFNDRAAVSSFPTSTSNATVRIFLFGQLAAEFDQALDQTGDLWRVGRIAWPSGAVEAIGELAGGAQCGFF
ncbi:MAG: choice-of-anchor D domain-containing protein [Myxococcota bacterium]